ncbi:MAG: DUF4342 domain-containing protein, partial [Rhizobiaceae bacterium]
MDKTKKGLAIFQEIEVARDQLVEKVKELACVGSVRQQKIRVEDGITFLEVPLNLGLAVGGVVVLAAPWLAILGAIAAMVAKLRIEVEPDVDEEAEDTS